jgi:hypothetical protein
MNVWSLEASKSSGSGKGRVLEKKSIVSLLISQRNKARYQSYFGDLKTKNSHKSGKLGTPYPNLWMGDRQKRQVWRVGRLNMDPSLRSLNGGKLSLWRA